MAVDSFSLSLFLHHFLVSTSVAFIVYLTAFRCKFAACRTRGRRSSRVTAQGRCPPSTAGAEGDHTRPDGAPIRTRRYTCAPALYERPIRI